MVRNRWWDLRDRIQVRLTIRHLAEHSKPSHLQELRVDSSFPHREEKQLLELRNPSRHSLLNKGRPREEDQLAVNHKYSLLVKLWLERAIRQGQLLASARKTVKTKGVQISQLMKKWKRVVQAELHLSLMIAKKKAHSLLSKFLREVHPSALKRSLH